MTKMTDTPLTQTDYERIARHLSGEETPSERATTVQWVADRAERGRVLDMWRRLEGARRLPVEWDAKAAWTRFSHTIVQEEQTAETTLERISPSVAERETVMLRASRLHVTRTSYARRFWTVGAAVAVLFVLAVTGVATREFWSRGLSHVPTYATYVTGNGERARVELRDGTVVTLNVGSRLSISGDFGQKNRTVYLRYGQAYFQVMHASGMPFVVNAAGSRTTVLGTAFGVRTYSRDTVQVAVRDGKVALNGTVLTRNDVAAAAPHGSIHVTHEQNVGAILGFVNGRLVLNDVALQAAIPDLERWYDVDIRLGDSALGSHHISAVFLSGSARDLMDNLQAIFGVRVVRDGRTLTLYSRG